MLPIAHAKEAGTSLHFLEEHLREVGEMAAGFAASRDFSEWARLAGRWHDLGKYAPDFQTMIREATGVDPHEGDGTTQARIDHSSAGALLAWKSLAGGKGFPLAAVIAGHHCGLVDKEDLLSRLAGKQDRLDAALGALPPTSLLQVPALAFPAFIEALPRVDRMRAVELWTRLLFSLLVDADSLDTERFCQPDRFALRGQFEPIASLRDRLDAYLAQLPAKGRADLGRLRSEIQARARVVALQPPGIFTLTVPTGGGKTFAGAVFGLHHAAKHGLERVIVVPPFTSIIEQNAGALRRALGDDAVLEHHSALDPDHEVPTQSLAAENWDAPVIVTTAVQLLESLFARKRSKCRKLHRVARSVIVLDEAQTLPPEFLAPILDVLQSLVRDHGASVVLSTATQPALQKRPKFQQGFEPARMVEIAPDPKTLAVTLRRVRVEWPPDLNAPVAWPELARTLVAHPQVLCIVHRTQDALELVQAVDEASPGDPAIHLSARMCPAHRAAALDTVRDCLRQGRPVCVVSTQLIEAGVDVDFPVVFRALGGLDSLAQAAGRCNREGLRPEGVLHVFVAPTPPPPGAPLRGLAVARTMLAADPVLDLFAPATSEDFFRQLYFGVDVDKFKIQESRESLMFRKVAEDFKLIDDQVSVIVPYGAGLSEFGRLLVQAPNRRDFRLLQRFGVGLSRFQFRRLEQAGALCVLMGSVHALAESHRHLYDARVGLKLGGPLAAEPESYFV